jgi:hypothetical protein
MHRLSENFNTDLATTGANSTPRQTPLEAFKNNDNNN